MNIFNTKLKSGIINTCEKEIGEKIYFKKDITTIPSAVKCVYFVQLASGLKIKIHMFSRDVHTKMDVLENHIRMINHAKFSKILAHGDNWIASEWIYGIPVSQSAISDDILNKAAYLLSTIHKAKTEFSSDISNMKLSEIGHKLNEKIPVLVSNDVISQIQSNIIFDLYNSLSADKLNISLIHGDFSPDNIVSSENELYSVDNETMKIHFIEYDLGRAVNLWNEWNLSGNYFFHTYLKYSSIDISKSDLTFWSVFNFAYRIAHRIECYGKFNMFCVKALRRMLELRVINEHI